MPQFPSYYNLRFGKALLLLASAAALSFAFAPSLTHASRPGVVASTGSLVSAAPMLEPRSGHAATLLANGSVLITGGMRRNQDFLRSSELFDPSSGKFHRTADMNFPRVGHTATLLHDGKVLIAGGWIGRDATDTAELYDPAVQKFTLLPKMTSRRTHHTATLLANGDVLIVAGVDHDGGGAALASAEIFHASSLTFESIGALHLARQSHTATLLTNGRVLFVGGRSEGNKSGQPRSALVAPAEIFDPGAQTFAATGSLLTPRYKHTAGLLPDGRVLIAGGSDERDWTGTLTSTEIYDLRTGGFTAAAPLHDSRFKLPIGAAQLLSGKLLIGGGSQTVEIFDPSIGPAGQFLIAPGRMNDSWHYLTETRLADGRVLFAGGYPDSDHCTNEAYLFIP